MGNLDYGVIGNCTISALVDPDGRIVWACMPRLDGDPVFSALLDEDAKATTRVFAIELQNHTTSTQKYERNTAILITRLFDGDGNCVEIVDFAPRCKLFGRNFKPVMLVRRIRPVVGSPVIRVRLKPCFAWGSQAPQVTIGSNHVRYVGNEFTVRLTTDASLTAVIEETPFVLGHELTFLLGPDETIEQGVVECGSQFLNETRDYWHQWVRYLSIPFEWQEAVIRAAITLKISAYEDTGAIVAAMTTSIPEAPNSGRNWDYRYCWLRDSYFVVSALNRLGVTGMMERYLHYIVNIAATRGGMLQPVYRISGRADLDETTVVSLSGFKGMGPVRLGNAAYQQVQHDVYGSAVLAATHMFFDQRLSRPGTEALFHRLELLGEHAVAIYDRPDAGIWELRNSAAVHTFSSVMCWAACDRLARIARQLGLPERITYWRERADRMHEAICREAWNADKGSFVDSFGGNELDASLLLLHELDFLPANDPRFIGTIKAVERELKHGDFIYRYVKDDDFGKPDVSFTICTFWYIDALNAVGRRTEARELFEKLLACRNPLGLLSEDIDIRNKELWGNFPQTYSMVGLIQCALRLSTQWDEAF